MYLPSRDQSSVNTREIAESKTLGIVSEEQFEAGTVHSHDPEHRQNRVILNFGASAHAKLLQNRLLVWFPLIARPRAAAEIERCSAMP